MSTWQAFVVALLLHVTLITTCTCLIMFLFRRHPALANTAGVVGLGIVLLSPITVRVLPPTSVAESLYQLSFASDPTTSLAEPVSSTRDNRLQRQTRENPRGGAKLPSEFSSSASIDPTGSSASRMAKTAARSGGRQSVRANAFGAERPIARQAGATETLLGGLLIVWACGVMFYVVRLIMAAGRLAALKRTLAPFSAGPDVRREISAVLPGVRLPRIAVSAQLPTPCVIGIWCPVVAIPAELATRRRTKQLVDALIHELAHIVRRDPWINVAQRIASVLLWPHPMIHLLCRMIATSREDVCDNYVLRHRNATDYAQTLLHCAQRCERTQLAVGLLGGDSSKLERRIAHLLSPRRDTATRLGTGSTAALAFLLVAFGALSGGVGEYPMLGAHAAEPPGDEQGNVEDAEGLDSTGEQTQEQIADALRTKIEIAGTLANESGEPVSGATVRVYRCKPPLDPPTLLTTRTSSSDGTFEGGQFEVSFDEYGMSNLVVVVTADGHTSALTYIRRTTDSDDLQLELASQPGTLVGFVTGPDKEPIEGALVYVPGPRGPFPGCLSATTDAKGKYRITDVRQWDQAVPAQSRRGLVVEHPEYPRTMIWYTSVPDIANVQLTPPATVEGRVIDAVAGKPVPGVTVSAQGVARSGWAQTRTDDEGRYRLLLEATPYNIWAEMEDRIPLAVNSIQVAAGQRREDADILMVRGGFVYGKYIDAATGMPIQPTEKMRVAHYGPARPRSGAAVTSTRIEQDGSFRLRVAPGQNYVYVMGGSASATVEIEEGQELELNLISGRAEDRRQNKKDAPELRRNNAPLMAQAARLAERVPPSRERGQTPVGRLLDQLEQQNSNRVTRFRESWLRALKQIVDAGPDAVPELIQELDATDDDMMMRCLGFALRAIGDRRAVPALIRAIPKTLRPPGSDMGLRAEDEELLAFAQKFDLGKQNRPGRYGLGRPVREVLGALQVLTGKQFNDDQLYHTFLSGGEAQRQMKMRLYERQASVWSDWWESNAVELGVPAEYRKTHLPERQIDVPMPKLEEGAHYKADSGSSGWVLESILNPDAQHVFFDLDTSRTARLPEKWRSMLPGKLPTEEISRWATQQGFDLVGTQVPIGDDGQTCYAIQPLGMQVWELDESRWWQVRPRDITLEELIDEGRPVEGFLFHQQANFTDHLAAAPFLVVTAEGTPGLIFVGVEVNDDSLKAGVVVGGDHELQPIAFSKGRRFGYAMLETLQMEKDGRSTGAEANKPLKFPNSR